MKKEKPVSFEVYEYFEMHADEIKHALQHGSCPMPEFEQGKRLGIIEGALNVFIEPHCPIDSEEPWTDENKKIARACLKTMLYCYEDGWDYAFEYNPGENASLLYDGIYELFYKYMRLYK